MAPSINYRGCGRAAPILNFGYGDNLLIRGASEENRWGIVVSSVRLTLVESETLESTAADVGDADELKFLSAVMEEFASDHGIEEAEIEAAIVTAGNDSVPMDNFIARRLVGLQRAVQKISPAKGSLLLRVIRQGYTYLSSPGAANAVDGIVRSSFRSPQVLITHSLGTVIAFNLLREMEANGTDVQIPLFITMGSPLGLDAFKAKLGAPRRKPAVVVDACGRCRSARHRTFQ